MSKFSIMKKVYSTVLVIISLLAILSFSTSEPAVGSNTIARNMVNENCVECADPMKTDSDLRVLLFSGTGWYRHPGIPAINGWLVRLGAQNNMQIDVSETGRDISKEKLEKYDVLILNSISKKTHLN